MLVPLDWHWTMGDPAAAEHQLPTDGGGFYYRGLRVWVVFDQSRIMDADEAERDRWG
ncbi:MAG: hypothetical protein ACYDD1_06785 [Caulobacteraceae bacterium]